MGPHTHRASTPPSAYQGENSQGRESEPRESKMVRMREREEQEVSDLYQPPTSPLSCARKSKLHLLTAFMIWHSRKMSENCHKCFQRGKQARSPVCTRNRLRWPYAVRLKVKERSGWFPPVAEHRWRWSVLLITKIQFTVAPFQAAHQLCSQAHTHRWGDYPAMHITNRFHVSSVDLFCSKLFCVGLCSR